MSGVDGRAVVARVLQLSWILSVATTRNVVADVCVVISLISLGTTP